MLYPKFNVKYLIIFYILFINNRVCAGNGTYWQQGVKYDIHATLDDSAHYLSGNITIEYTNNSPERLSYLYFHLWPNAYKNENTAFAKQFLEIGKADFHYAPAEDYGYIDSLNFTVNDIPVTLQYDSTNIDIAKIILNRPLEVGEKTTIRTPFRVKIPASFSRMGHTGQSYQISQWYPKPAVYDQYGWHAFPYLDQGEFYSEYGTFDVDITLPKNYVVGASGDLKNEDERAWMDSLAEVTKKVKFETRDLPFPPSDPATKTLHYHLEHAHDFAWFADKRYHVVKDTVKLPNSDRVVTTWALFNDRDSRAWKHAAEYVKNGVYWYSKWVGEYPYDVATAVEGGLGAGSGMEYPTITVIGSINNTEVLEDVVVHEIGHNWFYGILGSNEREHPWMDEGINTYYEYRYEDQQHPNRKLFGLAGGLAGLLGIDDFKDSYLTELAYRYVAIRNIDQPIDLHAAKYTSLNYGAVVYMKTALAMRNLANYLGQDTFDKAMQAYFDTWQYKHPYPSDLKAVLEKSSGKNLDWFFGDFITTNKRVDYAIAKVKQAIKGGTAEITIKNRGDLNVPFSVSGMKDDKVAENIWLPGCTKDTTITFPAGYFDEYRIDGAQQTVQVNRKDDNYRVWGIMHKVEKVSFKFLGSVDDPHKNQLYFVPVLGWNNYDKTMLGLAFYNHFVPGKHFEYELAPMIGIGSVNFDYLAHMGYTWTPRPTKLKTINFSVYSKRFSYQLTPEVLTYNKLAPQLTFDFKPKSPLTGFYQQLSFRSITIFMNAVDYVLAQNVVLTPVYNRVVNNIYYTVNEAAYKVGVDRVLFPYSLNVSLQQGNQFMRLSGEAQVLLSYEKPKKGLTLRLFGGGFLWNNADAAHLPDPGFRLYYGTGNDKYQKDFLFDELFFARNTYDGVFSQQVALKDAAFRTPNAFGSSIKNWLISLNIHATLPKNIPIKPYLNIAGFGGKIHNVSTDANTRYTTIAVEGGIALVLIPDAFEINFPLFFATKISDASLGASGSWYVGRKSNDSGNILAGKKYYQLITFVLNLNKLNPITAVRNFHP